MAAYGFSRRYWSKVFAQQIASSMPGRLGDSVNRIGSRLFAGKMEHREEAGGYRIERSLRNIRLAREYANAGVLGQAVLEIGTGWRGADGLLLSLLGAERVVSIDHAPWLRDEGLRRSALELLAQRSQVSAASEDGRVTEDRYLLLEKWVASDGGLAELHGQLGITCLVGDVPALVRSLASDLDFRAGVIWTESVLQRIPKDQLGAILASARTCALPHAWFLHRTDQRDIHCLAHAKTGDHPLRYLAVPERIFRTCMSGRLLSQNRLRESQFQKMFADAGFSTSFIESRTLDGDLDFVQTIGPLSMQFRGLDIEDLAVRASIFVGRMSDESDGEPDLLTREYRVLSTATEVES